MKRTIELKGISGQRRPHSLRRNSLSSLRQNQNILGDEIHKPKYAIRKHIGLRETEMPWVPNIPDDGAPWYLHHQLIVKKPIRSPSAFISTTHEHLNK